MMPFLNRQRELEILQSEYKSRRFALPIKLQPVGFDQFSAFFPNRSANARMERYAVLSGISKYIEMAEDADDLFSAIRNNFLKPDRFFYQEPRFLLSEEILGSPLE
jgi:AAA+ ATPase superfamily predicted ATPase